MSSLFGPTDPYVRRVIDTQLDAVFVQLPAILLDGPKGVGKTSTALQRCASVRHLDIESVRTILDADPSIVATDPPPVLLDEWHRLPALWDTVRRLVDEDNTAGRFLLTGSPPARGTHSGAGRITTLRMRPLCLPERGIATPTVSFGDLIDGRRATVAGRSPLTLSRYVDEIIAGGFPGMRSTSGEALTLVLDGYLERIVDHDLPEAGFTVRRPATVRSWMRAYAAATSTTASWETIRDAATPGIADKPARATTIAYTELLTSLRILDPVEAWVPGRNRFAPLTVGSKHHLTDPALAARLLRRNKTHLLSGIDGPVIVPRDGPLLGDLFESLAAQSLRTLAQAVSAHVYHLRTKGGRHEIDFIVERDGGVLAVEVKLSASINDEDVKHLIWLREQIGDDLIDSVVITTGTDAYRRSDGIAVIPLALLGP